MDFKCRVDAVLPAGGCGERMGLPVPKQFCKVLGRPLISYTISAFERLKWLDNVVVVIPPSKQAEMLEIVAQYHGSRVKLVDGASVRHRSIYNGLVALKDGEDDRVVVIHDAVRPFVEQNVTEELVQAAYEYGSAGAIRPLVSTVIATDCNGFLDHSLDRSKYRASEMPQAFKYDVIMSAYQKCTDYDFDYGTECLHLVDKYCGIKARLIEGPDSLWKVTLKKDLYATEGVILEKANTMVFHNDVSNFSQLAGELEKQYKVIKADLDYNHEDFPCNHILFIDLADQFKDLLSKDNFDRCSGAMVVGLLLCKDPAAMYQQCYTLMLPLTKIYPKETLCLNLVLVNEVSDVKKLAEFVQSLFTKRNTELHGQIFIV